MGTLNPRIIALSFVEKFFPDCPVIILTGSSKNVEVLKSDIDLVLFSASVGHSFHDKLNNAGVDFDVMVVPLHSYEEAFSYCATHNADGTLLRMVTSGIIIKDETSVADEILDSAWSYYQLGYRGMLPEKVQSLNNAIERRIDFLKSRPVGLDRCLMAYSILDLFLNIYLWFHVGWTVSGKQRAMVLHEVNPLLHNQVYKDLRRGTLSDDFSQFAKTIELETNLLTNAVTKHPRHQLDTIQASPGRAIFAISLSADYYTLLKEIVLCINEEIKHKCYVIQQQGWFEVVFFKVAESEMLNLVADVKNLLQYKTQYILDVQILNTTLSEARFGGRECFIISESIWSKLLKSILAHIKSDTLSNHSGFKLLAPYYLVGLAKGLFLSRESFSDFIMYYYDLWVLRSCHTGGTIKYHHIAERAEYIKKGHDQTFEKYRDKYKGLFENLLSQDWESSCSDEPWIEIWTNHVRDAANAIREIKNISHPQIKWHLLKSKYPNAHPDWLLNESIMDVCFTLLNHQQHEVAFITAIIKHSIFEQQHYDMET